MQLNPEEKSILAYFTSESDAYNALNSLKQRGFNDVRLDQVLRFPTTRNKNRSMPTLSSLVMGNYEDHSHGPLMAADPAASGMSTGYDYTGGTTYLITIVADNHYVQEITILLQQYGAMFS